MDDGLEILAALGTIEHHLVVRNRAIALLKKLVVFNDKCWEMVKSLENDQNSELAEMYLQEIDKFYTDAKEEWERK